MLLRASLVSAALCVLLSGSASAASGDHDPDQETAGPAGAGTPRAISGKAVHFDRGWLTPFFQHGQAQKAVEQFPAEEWAGAETGFAKAIKSLARGPERQAASYMLALSRANQGKWGDAAQLFET